MTVLLPLFCGSFCNSQLGNSRNSNFQRYDLLKAHAEEKLEEANKEIDNISRGQVGLRFWILDELFLAFLQDAEIAKLTALLKKTEMKATSLERTVKEILFNLMKLIFNFNVVAVGRSEEQREPGVDNNM